MKAKLSTVSIFVTYCLVMILTMPWHQSQFQLIHAAEYHCDNSDFVCENIDETSFQNQCPCDNSIYRNQINQDDSDIGARIAYLITLHNQRTLNDSYTLLKSIIANGFIVLIHVDTKLPQDEYYEKSELVQFVNDYNDNCTCCCGAMIQIESIFDVTWGQWSMMDPTLWAMQQLTTNDKYKNKWDVFINLSADSMPVYKPQILSKYFHGPLQGTNFVTSSSCPTGLLPTNINSFPSWWHKSGHYKEKGDFVITYNDTIEDNGLSLVEETVTLTIHFGSQWMALTSPFVEYIASSMKRPDSLAARFKEELIRRERLMADEVFIPTLLANHFLFKETLPKVSEDGNLISMKGMHAIRYERMDEHMPDAFLNVVKQQRYEVPVSFESFIDVPRPWGPYYLGTYDLANIKDSGALFIRKVAKEIDPNIFRLFPVSHDSEIPYIQWPKEMKISPTTNFDEIIKYWKRKNDE